ncbi:MAG: tripartite tricarboxylate transporter substrate binding protein [Enhydrobacter sp.]|nr:MAG: tripartite tricarboxylate transporter substrate binding protein [Enhydrobacter sp.]
MLATAAVPLAGAHAQTWPSKPIRLVVSGPAGGIIDIGGRAIVDPLSKALGQPVLIDLRPGGNGLIAAQIVIDGPADGHSLLLTVSEVVSFQYMVKVSFDVIRDLTPVASIGEGSAVICVAKSLPVSTLQELVDHAQRHPGKINYLNPANGTRQHLVVEQIKSRFGVDMTSIPYRGLPPGLVDLLAERIELGIISTSIVLPYIMTGAVKPIAALGSTRIVKLPSLPTMTEQGFGEMEIASVLTIFAPRRVQSSIVERLNTSVTTAVETPDARARLAAGDIEPITMKSDRLAAWLLAERDRLHGLITRLGLTSS